MSLGLAAFLLGALTIYLLVVLPLSADENPLGRTVVVAPTLTVTLQGHHTRRQVLGVVRRWERGWNGTKGEQRVTPDDAGQLVLPSVTLRSWAARVVPHHPVTEQFLHLVVSDTSGAPQVEDEPVWTHLHLTYDDHPLELSIKR